MSRIKTVLRLVLFLGFSLWGQGLLAHGLPGSTLTFQTRGDRVGLRITMPLEEFNLVLSKLGDVDLDQGFRALSEPEIRRIYNYLMKHLVLTDLKENIVEFSMLSARIDGAFDDHVGQYQLLVVELSASQVTFPLTLQYDAIMHEIRNHRATMFLEQSDGTVLNIGMIRSTSAAVTSSTFVIEMFP